MCLLPPSLPPSLPLSIYMRARTCNFEFQAANSIRLKFKIQQSYDSKVWKEFIVLGKLLKLASIEKY